MLDREGNPLGVTKEKAMLLKYQVHKTGISPLNLDDGNDQASMSLARLAAAVGLTASAQWWQIRL